MSGANTATLFPAQLADLLSRTIPAKLPVLIQGAPGVGKSAIVEDAAKRAGAVLEIMHPVVSDPVDFKGFPVVCDGGADFAPFGDLKRLVNADRLTVCFIDDLGQASASVQAACMQLILARRVGQHHVSPHVVFVAATNRREDRAAVSGLLEPLKSRFASIVQLEPSLDDWCRWAVSRDLPPELVAFIRFRPDLLSAPNPTPDMTNAPSPRTVANVGALMALGLPDSLEYPAYAGAAGAGFASELLAYLEIYRSLPDIDKLIAKPKTAALPDLDRPGIVYALCGALAYRASVDTFPALLQISDRLPDEYRAMLVVDSLTRTKPADGTENPIATLPVWTDWVLNNSELLEAV